MKQIDVASRNQKELERLKQKVAAFLRSPVASCNKGEVDWSIDGDFYWLEVVNDGELGDYIGDIFKKSEFVTWYEVKEHEGVYMWSADVYVRPSTTVTFRF